MRNFVFYNSTKLIFGKGSISSLTTEIPLDKKIMIVFGGGSVRKNGVYEQVKQAMSKHVFVEFWGIEPNPTVDTIRKAVELGKKNRIDFLLSVGGGSVLDATKLIAVSIPYDGDPWNLVVNSKLIKYALPFCDVMTLPATGSEMNTGAVISNVETKEKFPFNFSYPEFSILDPKTTYSLPSYQIACGIADTFVHVMEQYLTFPNQSLLMDRWAEGILQVLVEIAPKIKENKKDYDLMSNFMLSATMGLNGFIAMGVEQDWSTHMIGHELTALHGITHGQSLAIVFPATIWRLKEQKEGKILQYGERIWKITTGTNEEKVMEIIQKTEDFFRSLGLVTKLHEVGITDTTIMEVERRFNARNVAFGECHNVTGTVAREILELAK